MKSEENNRQDYDNQQNYNSQQNYDNQQNYNGQQNYDNQQNYNSQQNYDNQQNYNGQQNYDSQQNYDNRQNYNNRGNYDYNGYQRPPKTPQPVSGMSIAALILGALSIVCSCCGFGGIIFGSLGIIIAVISKGHASMQTNSKIGLGLSIAGLILGLVITIMLFAFSSYVDTSEHIQSFEYEAEPYEDIPYEEYPDDSYRYYDNEPQYTPYSRDLEDFLNENQPQEL